MAIHAIDANLSFRRNFSQYQQELQTAPLNYQLHIRLCRQCFIEYKQILLFIKKQL